MVDRKFRLARIWSNQELRRIAPLFAGDIANVSGGDDVDKEGSTYHAYFQKAGTYAITNYGGANFRGFQDRAGEIELDLTADLPDSLKLRFDVVLNHTTLEHIFDVRKAFHTLCNLTKDIAIIIVPFCQVQHENVGYLDYWRFTPTCLRKLFDDEGMTVIYEAANESFNTSIYLLFVASRDPEKWTGKMPSYSPLCESGSWVGRNPSFKELTILLMGKIKSLLCHEW